MEHPASVLASLSGDFRFALRTLARRPAFAVVAILTLTLGIGATTAVFTVFRAVVLEPLPYREPDRLVALGHLDREWGLVPVSIGQILLWQDEATTVDGIAGFRRHQATVTGHGGTRRLKGVSVVGPLFEVLGVEPPVGRGLVSADSDSAGPRPVVLSPSAARQLLDPESVAPGQTLTLGGEAAVVVGVTGPDFGFPNTEVDYWFSRTVAGHDDGLLRSRSRQVVARLAVDADRSAMEAELWTLRPSFDTGEKETRTGVRATPLAEWSVGDVHRPLRLLLATAGLVLLLACANVANLLLGRASRRRPELAVRRALGAGRLRLTRQLLTESLALAATGGVMGTALALLLLRLAATALDRLPRAASISPDLGVLAFALALTLGTTLAAGTLPALALARDAERGPLAALRTGSGSLSGRKLQGSLLAAQIALAVTLVGGAGMLLRSLAELREVDPGMRTGHGLAVRVHSDPGEEDPLAVFRRLDEALRGLPDVRSVARSTFLPLNQRTGWASNVHIEGFESEEEIFLYRIVSAGYHEVLGRRLVAGRFLDAADEGGQGVPAIVNESLARRYWPRPEAALGAALRLGGAEAPLVAEARIVGVVANARDTRLDEDPRPVVSVPDWSMRWYPSYAYVLRTSLGEGALSTELRRVTAEVATGLSFEPPRHLEGLVDDDLVGRRASSGVLSVFATLSLLLAALGAVGVASVFVNERVRELAIRRALGASRSHLRGLVVRASFRHGLIGIAAGLFGAWGLGRALSSQLYGLGPADPTVLVGTGLLLLAVLLVATDGPARRAASTSPNEVLRET